MTGVSNTSINELRGIDLNVPAVNGNAYSIYSSGAAPVYINSATTITGSIAIGNTVAAAAGVASTHKVTISIGGSTYYLLATNV